VIFKIPNEQIDFIVISVVGSSTGAGTALHANT